MNVNIITVGDEILIGQVIDTNSAWMAQQLNLIGAKVTEIHSIGDTMEGITHALAAALQQAEVILVTGGLGPTKDDITKKSNRRFFGRRATISPSNLGKNSEAIPALGTQHYACSSGTMLYALQCHYFK